MRFLTIAWMWLAMAGHVIADELTVADFSIKPGETKNVSVELNNPSRLYTMLEFTLTLPEGVGIAQADDDYAVALNSGRCSDSFTVNVEEIAANTYKFLIFSGALDQITGSSGILFTMTLTAAADAAQGKVQGAFSGQLFVMTDDTGYEPDDKTFNVSVGTLLGDVNSDSEVNRADVTALVNIILGKDDGPNPVYDHEAANVNGDSKVSIADVTALVNLVLGKD